MPSSFWETVLNDTATSVQLVPEISSVSLRTTEVGDSSSSSTIPDVASIPGTVTLVPSVVLKPVRSNARTRANAYLHADGNSPSCPLPPTPSCQIEDIKRAFPCDYSGCTATFSHVSSKYRHIRTVHEGRRDHSCTFPGCNMQFGERSGLNKHTRTVHEGRRDHRCTVFGCSRRFAFKLHLVQHISTVHLRQKVHVCDICNYRFGQRSSLTRHRRKLHGWKSSLP